MSADSSLLSECPHCRGPLPYRLPPREPEANPSTLPPSPRGRYFWAGKPYARNWPRISARLGKTTDEALGLEIGVRGDVVGKMRQRLGISVFRKMDAWEHLLGVIPDLAIARRSGLHPATVFARRKALGIPRVSAKQRHADAEMRSYLASLGQLFEEIRQ